MVEKLDVVLVDDSRSVIAQLERIVANHDGASLVGVAASGAEALQVVNDLSPDLVLMDIVMPSMDGLTALRLLGARFPGVRVALVSSVGGSASRAEEAFRLGAIQVLCKPIDPEVLISLLDSELERKNLAREQAG